MLGMDLGRCHGGFGLLPQIGRVDRDALAPAAVGHAYKVRLDSIERDLDPGGGICRAGVRSIEDDREVGRVRQRELLRPILPMFSNPRDGVGSLRGRGCRSERWTRSRSEDGRGARSRVKIGVGEDAAIEGFLNFSKERASRFQNCAGDSLKW